MIARLWGSIEELAPESLIFRAGSVGYRIAVSPYAYSRFSPLTGPLMIRTFLIWSEHQETPTLVGFFDDREELLFHELRKVGGLGAMKAIRMISAPPETIWRAIASGDLARLRQLKGVGETTARKLLAELRSRVPEELPGVPAPLSGSAGGDSPGKGEDLSPSGPVESVREILVRQFGHSSQEADRMIRRALQKNPSLATVEDLFNDVYRHGVD